jgi:hypothetical protein
MEKRVIKTNLVQRDEVFKVMAVAEATGFPILLEGPPGVGKTRALLDYVKAMYPNMAEVLEKSFILETDEGTRASEIKGRIDINKLVTQNQYAVVAPIVAAEAVLINEVDKASAGLRNSLLGVMNEKYLFNGNEKVKCQWKVFCAAVNEIPAEEKGSPFWDRFVIKHKISRITKPQMMKYYDNVATSQRAKDLMLNVPSQAEIDALKIDPAKMEKFLEVCFDSLSDRTLSYIPKLIGAVHFVYGLSLNKAMIKVCELLLGYQKSRELGKHIEPKELADIRSNIEMIMAIEDYDLIVNQIKAIQTQMEDAVNKKLINTADIEELTQEVNFALNENPVYNQKPETQDADTAQF